MLMLKVWMFQAILGGMVEVPTLSGKIEVKVRVSLCAKRLLSN